MKPRLDNRKSKRFKHKATVMLKEEPVGYISYGKMINYSDSGMLIESDVPFKHGTYMNIIIDKPVYKAALQNYYGTVQWCMELPTVDTSYHFGRYGIGIQYA